jgi:hypothetical protein
MCLLCQHFFLSYLMLCHWLSAVGSCHAKIAVIFVTLPKRVSNRKGRPSETNFFFKEFLFICWVISSYEGVSKSFRTGRLEWELQMVLLSDTRCSCIVILWVSLVSFATITLCIASQRVFIVVYFVMTQSGKLLVTPSYLVLKLCKYA